MEGNHESSPRNRSLNGLQSSCSCSWIRLLDCFRRRLNGGGGDLEGEGKAGETWWVLDWNLARLRWWKDGALSNSLPGKASCNEVCRNGTAEHMERGVWGVNISNATFTHCHDSMLHLKSFLWSTHHIEHGAKAAQSQSSCRALYL